MLAAQGVFGIESGSSFVSTGLFTATSGSGVDTGGDGVSVIDDSVTGASDLSLTGLSIIGPLTLLGGAKSSGSSFTLN